MILKKIIIDLIKLSNSEVKRLDALISQTEEEKKMKGFAAECYKAQLNRLVEWVEYSIEYCDNKDNLIKFSGLN